ncbi:hypothetical protein Y032_0002g673 [Ancylostoma ceylanicum]|uniref:Uncharacterized protein n=1 Tax=Ancylostoma ceylanicum TaxID=53326 RepID=A0A016W2J6_9BILA|nr:hypothetical protein Y032_0002g673 [Ancylostoma ceylanicum]
MRLPASIIDQRSAGRPLERLQQEAASSTMRCGYATPPNIQTVPVSDDVLQAVSGAKKRTSKLQQQEVVKEYFWKHMNISVKYLRITPHHSDSVLVVSLKPPRNRSASVIRWL